MELVSTMEISGEEREIADAYAREQCAANAKSISILKNDLKKNNEEVSSHTSDKVIHITSGERDNWNAAKANATKVEKSSTNGNVLINGIETNVYTHPSGTNPHGTTKSDIGLGNVDNTKDIDKPISTKQQEKFDEINSNLDALGYGENSGNSNLFYGELKTDKKNGVTITKQEDGTYLLSGTASDACFLRLGSFNFINGKEYYLSTSAKGSLGGTHFARIRNNADNNTEKSIIKNVKYTPNTTEKQWFDIVIVRGTDVTNTVYKPMVSLMQYDYEPYIPSVKILAEKTTQIDDSLSVIGKCKNLLNPSHLGTTVMGITCTNNGDGTYALNGTATADLDLCIKGFKNLQLNKEYKMLGCPSGGSDSTYMLYDGSESDIKDIGKGKVYTPTKQPNINIRIMNGVTVNNLVFKPMLTENLSATYDDFVPYTGDGETLTADVSELKNDLGGLSFSVSGTTLSITDGINTWTLSN